MRFGWGPGTNTGSEGESKMLKGIADKKGDRKMDYRLLAVNCRVVYA